MKKRFVVKKYIASSAWTFRFSNNIIYKISKPCHLLLKALLFRWNSHFVTEMFILTKVGKLAITMD